MNDLNFIRQKKKYYEEKVGDKKICQSPIFPKFLSSFLQPVLNFHKNLTVMGFNKKTNPNFFTSETKNNTARVR